MADLSLACLTTPGIQNRLPLTICSYSELVQDWPSKFPEGRHLREAWETRAVPGRPVLKALDRRISAHPAATTEMDRTEEESQRWGHFPADGCKHPQEKLASWPGYRDFSWKGWLCEISRGKDQLGSFHQVCKQVVPSGVHEHRLKIDLYAQMRFMGRNKVSRYKRGCRVCTAQKCCGFTLKCYDSTFNN